MKYARFALLALGIVLFAKIEPVRADYYWCDMLCGPSASCDTQCVDGGTNITCGTYNGGAGSGMCYDPPQCNPNWTGLIFSEELGLVEFWWWHQDPDTGLAPHIDCEMQFNQAVYRHDQNECAQDQYSCNRFEDPVYHDVWPGYCSDIYEYYFGLYTHGSMDCPF
jgi:hypothetical protein